MADRETEPSIELWWPMSVSGYSRMYRTLGFATGVGIKAAIQEKVAELPQSTQAV